MASALRRNLSPLGAREYRVQVAADMTSEKAAFQRITESCEEGNVWKLLPEQCLTFERERERDRERERERERESLSTPRERE